VESNYLNLTPADLDKPVFRVVPIHRLLEAFQERRFVLVQPKKWDDPFEQLLDWSWVTNRMPIMGQGVAREQKLNVHRQKVRRFRERECVGQCWTAHKYETDAMWRIYTPNKDGVKMKSTPRKLLDALQQNLQQSKKQQCYIGKILYLKEKALIKAIEDINFNEPDGLAKSLMYKRREFSHEREIRLLFTGTSKEIFSFPIDPNQMIDEVVFDPRMHGALYEVYRLALGSLKYKNRIRQSRLYQMPSKLPLIEI
jgi:hypothetical protein